MDVHSRIRRAFLALVIALLTVACTDDGGGAAGDGATPPAAPAQSAGTLPGY